MTDIDLQYMRQALSLARRGIGQTSPNPSVGCVIVRNNEVVGEGWHMIAGGPHAEAHALRDAGDRARGADLYVTLEPCSHFGKTPPCADAVIAAGVARVFIGMVDPNPKVSGRGVEKLRAAGIEVFTGLLEDECRSINLPFIKHVTTGLPYLTLKSALTLDGKTATSDGDSRWVTGEPARRHVHALRGISDAVMVGIGTVMADDPQLTCRLEGGRDPVRVIIDSRLKIPLNAKVFNPDSPARTIIATVSDDQDRLRRISDLNADIIQCRDNGGMVDLRHMLEHLGALHIQSILLEGGATVAGAFFRDSLIDHCLLFFAPKLLGGDGIGLFSGPGVPRMDDAIPMDNISVRHCGSDIIIEGDPVYPCSQD